MSKARGVAYATFVVACSIVCAGAGVLRGSNGSAKQVDRLIELARSEGGASGFALDLCRIGPRPAGSRAHEEACAWALRTFKKLGLKNVHTEGCGPVPEWGRGALVLPASKSEAGATRVVDESAYDQGRPITNVVADIPGSALPDEYVIVGAHIDSTPFGTGAVDNASGAAAVMEAARLLTEAGVRPKRTIRFILFAGEESGLVGSRGYVAAHPDLVPRISAMFNMDNGTDFISKIRATEPMREDLRSIFAPVARLDPKLPFAVTPVDYLPAADPDLCARGGGAASAKQGCGGAVRVMRRAKDGSLEPVQKTLEELGISPEDLAAATTDSLGRTVVRVDAKTAGGCSAGGGSSSDMRLPDRLPGGDSTKVRMVAIGSSDHAPFLKAGIPSFFFVQDGDSTVAYPAHTEKDTYEALVPRYLEHSAAVVALGALGAANLDHMISRERLTAPSRAKSRPTCERTLPSSTAR